MQEETEADQPLADLLNEAPEADQQLADLLNEAPEADLPSVPPEADLPEPPRVDWITIRVPVVKLSGSVLPSRIRHTISLRGGDGHIRKAFGDLLEGCRAEGVRLNDQTAVDNWSAVFRLLGERVAAEVAPAVPDPASQ